MWRLFSLIFLLFALVEALSVQDLPQTIGFEYVLIRRGSSKGEKDGNKPGQGRPSSPSTRMRPPLSRPQTPVSRGSSQRPPLYSKGGLISSPPSGAQAGDSSSRSFSGQSSGSPSSQLSRTPSPSPHPQIPPIPPIPFAFGTGEAYIQRSKDTFHQIRGSRALTEQALTGHTLTGQASTRRVGTTVQGALPQGERQRVSIQDTSHQALLSQLNSPQATSAQQQSLAQSMPKAHRQALANALESPQVGSMILRPETRRVMLQALNAPPPDRPPYLALSPKRSWGQSFTLDQVADAASGQGSLGSPKDEEDNKRRQKKSLEWWRV